MNYTKWTYGFVRLKAADSVFISKTNIRREEMKKLVVGILILASFGLAACGNSNNTSQADTKKSSTQAETALTIKDSNGDQIEVPKNPEKSSYSTMVL